MSYPSSHQVENASLFQLVNWWRHLPSPAEWAIGKKNFNDVLDDEVKIMERIGERIKELGGITPGISKAVGWERRSSRVTGIKAALDEIVSVSKELIALSCFETEGKKHE